MQCPKRCIVFYHYIRNNSEHKVHYLRVEEFKAQVDFLIEHMPPLDPDEVVHCIRTGKEIREGFLLTFDDGFKEHYDIAYPYLRGRGLRGIFFPSALPYLSKKVPLANQLQVLIGDLGCEELAGLIISKLAEYYPEHAIEELPQSPCQIKRLDNSRINDLKYFLNFTLSWEISQDIIDNIFTEYVGDVKTFIRENYLSVEEIREMASGGMVFGGHTITHPYLTNTDRRTKEREISDSLNFIRDVTDSNVYSFCYPYGHYDKECLEILDETMAEVAFTTSPRDNLNHKDRFNIGRYDTVLLPPVSKFDIKELRYI